MAAIFKIDDVTGRQLDIYVSAETLRDARNPPVKKPAKNSAPSEPSHESDAEEPEDLELSFADGVIFAKEFNNFVKAKNVRVDVISIDPYQTLFSGKKTAIIPVEAYTASNGMSPKKLITRSGERWE